MNSTPILTASISQQQAISTWFVRVWWFFALSIVWNLCMFVAPKLMWRLPFATWLSLFLGKIMLVIVSVGVAVAWIFARFHARRAALALGQPETIRAAWLLERRLENGLLGRFHYVVLETAHGQSRIIVDEAVAHEALAEVEARRAVAGQPRVSGAP